MASSSAEIAGYLALLMGVSMEQGRRCSVPALVVISRSTWNMNADQADHHCSPLLSSPSYRLMTQGLQRWRSAGFSHSISPGTCVWIIGYALGRWICTRAAAGRERRTPWVR